MQARVRQGGLERKRREAPEEDRSWPWSAEGPLYKAGDRRQVLINLLTKPKSPESFSTPGGRGEDNRTEVNFPL